MTPFACSFCGLARREVQTLISGPKVWICNHCVALCNEIIDDEQKEARRPPTSPIRRTAGHVTLDDWAATCLDTLGCRIIWPVIPESKRMLSRAELAIGELLPELHSLAEPGSAIVIQVPDLDRASALLRNDGMFVEGSDLREGKEGRIAVFRTAEGQIAALLSIAAPTRE